jgi:transcriptional regulator with XRE-family HTH domain
MRKTTPLRNIRRARTLSQQDLARLVEISQQTLSKIERGAFVPGADVRARLAAVLGVSESDLFAGQGAAA